MNIRGFVTIDGNIAQTLCDGKSHLLLACRLRNFKVDGSAWETERCVLKLERLKYTSVLFVFNVCHFVLNYVSPVCW